MSNSLRHSGLLARALILLRLSVRISLLDEVPDPHALDIRLTIAGEKLQHSNTRELIFRIPELIEYLSQVMTLEPGDIISTGTPAGVGLGRTPPRWLRAGEEVTIEIDQIGTLTNPVIAEHTGTDVIER
jgi:2-keto-4-pentenoate hydratase/2-oxohepta-3-ene-1,7-dioic acid hydratase in catechol pathway